MLYELPTDIAPDTVETATPFGEMHPPLVLAALKYSLRTLTPTVPTWIVQYDNGTPFGYATQLALTDLLLAAIENPSEMETVLDTADWVRTLGRFTDTLEPFLVTAADTYTAALVSNESTTVLYDERVLPVLCGAWQLTSPQWPRWEEFAAAAPGAVDSLRYLRDDFGIETTGLGATLVMLREETNDALDSLIEQFAPRTSRGETRTRKLFIETLAKHRGNADLTAAVVPADQQ